MPPVRQVGGPASTLPATRCPRSTPGSVAFRKTSEPSVLSAAQTTKFGPAPLLSVQEGGAEIWPENTVNVGWMGGYAEPSGTRELEDRSNVSQIRTSLPDRHP